MELNMKKTLGRRKIEIKKIDKKSSLLVTFSKRRHGLFRKASELALLCGAEVAFVVKSPAEKIFTFAHPSVEALIGRVMAPPSAPRIIRHGDCGRRGYEEAIRTLEAEKSRLDGGGFWWEAPFEGLDLHQLEEFSAALEGLRDNVAARVAKFESVTIDSAAVQVQDFSAAASVQELSVVASTQEFSGAAYSAPASVQEFSGTAYSAAASFQELSVVASTQEFSGAAYSASASIQEFSGAACSASAAIQEFSAADQSAAASFQEFSGVDHSSAKSFQEFSGPASASDSSYLSQSIDQDQDLFDVLDSSYLFQSSDQDQEQDFLDMFN